MREEPDREEQGGDKPAVIRTAFGDEDKHFFSSLESEDDVGAILRAHLHMERLLERLIETRLVRHDRLEWDQLRLSFVQKLTLVDAMGLVSEALIGPLRWANWLRNEFGHTLYRELQHDDEKRLLDRNDVATFLANLRRSPIVVYQPTDPLGKRVRSLLSWIRFHLRWTVHAEESKSAVKPKDYEPTQIILRSPVREAQPEEEKPDNYDSE